MKTAEIMKKRNDRGQLFVPKYQYKNIICRQEVASLSVDKFD